MKSSEPAPPTNVPQTDVPLVLTLFGPMQVLIGGHPLPRLRSRKTLWLLVLLVLRQGRPVEREWLAGTLWPDADQNQAFANLRPVLSDLRRALGAAGERLQLPSRHTLCLDLAGADVDVLAFDAAVSRNTPDALAEAVALYTGPLLEGCAEEWAPQERRTREEDCLLALGNLTDAALAAGDFSRATEYSRRAVALDPWRDGARRGLMEALSRGGDINAALQVYREYVQVLREDPRAVPDEQTSALYTRLRAEARRHPLVPVRAGTEAQGVTPAITGSLPHPLTELVGREEEILEVVTWLRRSRLVTLTGPGGVGKTRLALAVAAEAAAESPDGVWLVALDALSDGSQVVAQIAGVLGVREEPERPLLHSLTTFLEPKRLLLVLDNCEHLLEASVQATGHLLRGCAGMRVLATSREALGISGETVWLVPGLAVPPLDHSLAGMPQDPMGYGSVRLFVERAQAVQRDFRLMGNTRAVVEVCARLEGIPLAIELAAARVRVLTAEQIASRLGDHLGLLAGASRLTPARQQALKATLDWSYALLSVQEQLLLARLSAFADGWTLEAAEAVCSGRGIEVGQVLDLLTSLVDKSLVVFIPGGKASGRYRLPETTRQYAVTRLEDPGEAARVRAGHRDYFLALVERVVSLLTGAGQSTQMARLEAERENLRAALAWCEAEDEGAEAELRLAGTLWQFWWVRGDYEEGRRHLARALARAGGQTGARAAALQAAASLAYGQADLTAAQPLYQESREAHRQMGDYAGMAAAAGGLGSVARDRGDYVAAHGHYEEGLTLFREAGHRHGVAWSLGNIGSVLLPQGRLAAAKALYQESLGLYRELEDERGVAWSLSGLSDIASKQGDIALVRILVQECLTIRRTLGNKPDVAWSLISLGNITRDEGDYVAAHGHYEEGLTLFREIGDRRGIAVAMSSLGDVAYDLDDLDKAQSLYAESLDIRRLLGNKPDVAWLLDALGRVAYAQGDSESARAHHEESLALFQESQDMRGVASGLEGIAAVMLAQGDGRKAVHLWGGAQAIRKDVGVPLPPKERASCDRRLDEARTQLGADTFAAAWEIGLSLPWAQAVSDALGEPKG